MSNSPAQLPVPVVLLPYTVNVFLKILSRILSRTSITDSLELLFTRDKPPNSLGISRGQLAIISQTVSHVYMRHTAILTTVASLLATLAIALKASKAWLWWALLGAVIAGFLLLAWTLSKDIYFFRQKRFGISNSTWATALFCTFDIALATFSVVSLY